MRILVVGINYAPDLIGVAKYTTELCEALASFGHEVHVVTAPPYYPGWNIPTDYRSLVYRSAKTNDVQITRVPIYVPRIPTGAKRLIHHASFAISSSWPVLSASLRWRPDVIFAVAPSLMSAAIPSWIGRRVGAFTWLHLQDFEIDAAFDLGLLSNKRLRDTMVAIEHRILRSFDCVSTISPRMTGRLAAKGVDRESIRELRNWTDTDQFVEMSTNSLEFRREHLGLDYSHFVCLYSGTISHKQGLELIIDAARSVNGQGSMVRFVICGEGPHKASLKSAAAGLNNVQFLALQEQRRFFELLRATDVHLIPQRAEAADLVLPSKIGAILASGKPSIVMASEGTGLAEEIGKGGLLVSPGDVGQLVAAVTMLAKNPTLCRSLGEEARRLALSRWDKKLILSDLNELLKSVRGNTPPNADSLEVSSGPYCLPRN